MLKTLVILGAILGMSVAGNCAVGGQRPGGQGDAELDRAIKDLGAPDEAIRKVARGIVLSRSNEAKPKLVNALKVLTENLGRGYRVPEESELSRFHGMQRQEVYLLVGKLQIQEAIPWLIRAMEETGDHGSRGCEEVIWPLIAIGPASVQPLLNSIANASETSFANRQKRRDDTHIWLVIDVDPQIIQMRAAKALGDIGDVVALPILDRLYKAERIGDYWMAIQLIKKKNGLKYERWADKTEVVPFCID